MFEDLQNTISAQRTTEELCFDSGKEQLFFLIFKACRPAQQVS